MFLFVNELVRQWAWTAHGRPHALCSPLETLRCQTTSCCCWRQNIVYTFHKTSRGVRIDRGSSKGMQKTTKSKQTKGIWMPNAACVPANRFFWALHTVGSGVSDPWLYSQAEFLCKVHAQALKKTLMNGKYLISSKHSRSTEPSVSFSVWETILLSYSFTIVLFFFSVWTLCWLQHYGAKTAPSWEQFKAMERTVWAGSWQGNLSKCVCVLHFGWCSKWNVSSLVVLFFA